MKEMDDIEQLFSNVFSDAEMTPPSSIKHSIDKELFRSKPGAAYWLSLLTGIGFVIIGSYFFAISELNAESVVHEQTQTTESVLTLKSVPLSTVKSNSIDAFSELNKASTVNNKKHVMKSVGSDKPKEVKNKKSEKPEVNSKKKLNYNSANGARHSVASLPNQNLIVSSVSKVIEKDKVKNNSEKETSERLNVTLIQSGVESINNDKLISLKTNPILPLELTIKKEPVTLDSLFVIEPKSKRTSLLTLSLYQGLSRGTNFIYQQSSSNNKLELTLAENTGYMTSLELNFRLNRFGLSSGFSFENRKENINRTSITSDLFYLGDTVIVSYPNPNDSSEVDSIYMPQYETIISKVDQNSVFSYNAFSLPVYVTFKQDLGNNMNFTMAAGARFTYVNYRLLNTDQSYEEIVVNHFGVSLNFRPEIRYSFNRFSLGLYGQFGYDIRTGVTFNEVGRRRYNYGAGISLNYSF